MCKKATCDICRKPTLIQTRLLKTSLTLIVKDKSTWWGCGSHVATVMDSVPEDQRCSCEPQVERGGKMYPPMAKQPS